MATTNTKSKPKEAVKKSKLHRKRKPTFAVMNQGTLKRVKHSWRKPRGIDNKKRIRCAFAGKGPRVGYGTPEAIKGMHPCGLHEVLVNNLNELEAAKGKAARIASSVGGRKRKVMEEKAKTLGIHLLN
ncbi:MAG: 50S ribosomal protein L32e [Candidatus Micrarchaeota archaeon]